MILRGSFDSSSFTYYNSCKHLPFNSIQNSRHAVKHCNNALPGAEEGEFKKKKKCKQNGYTPAWRAGGRAGGQVRCALKSRILR